MIQVIVFYTLKEAFTGLFAEAFKTIASDVHKEDGCLQYALFVSPYDATHFCLVEKWQSQDALDNHLKTKNLSDFRVQSEPWFAERPVIEIKSIAHERYA